jgi:hypothetical protein
MTNGARHDAQIRRCALITDNIPALTLGRARYLSINSAYPALVVRKIVKVLLAGFRGFEKLKWAWPLSAADRTVSSNYKYRDCTKKSYEHRNIMKDPSSSDGG